MLLTWAGMLRAADEGDRVYALPTVATADGLSVLRLMLQGDECYASDGYNYRSLQFDLVLPAGITLKESEQEGEYQYEVGNLFSTGTNVSITYHADGNRYRFIVYNLLGKRFTGHSGQLLTLQLEVDETVAHTALLEGAIERQVLGKTGNLNVHPEDNTFTITTGGDRAKGIYGIPFKTSNTSREGGGSYEGFMLFIDQTEARALDGHAYRSAQFDLHLPQGMHLRRKANTEEEYSVMFTMLHNKNHTVTVRYHEDGDFYRVLIYSLSGVNFGYSHSATADKDSTFMWAPEITLDENFVAGEYTIRIDNQILGIDANKNVSIDPSEIGVTHDFKLTYDDQRTSANGVLNFPVAVDLNVAMTAGEWRTFSLPMSLTEMQLKEAFGEDVKLAQVTCDTIPSTNTQLTMHFQTCDVSEGMESLKPYLICPSKNVTSAHFDNVIVKNTTTKGTGIQMYMINPAGTIYMGAGAMIGSYFYADTGTRYSNVMNTTSYPNFLMVDGEQFYSSNINNDPIAPMNAFRCIFYHRAINNLLNNLTDVDYVAPTGEFSLLLESGQQKTVQGALVTENDVEYIAVGKTRYEVISKPTRRGDVNGDGLVDVADITALVNYLSEIGEETEEPLADFDGDMDVDEDDLTLLVGYVLGEDGSQVGSYTVRNVSPVVGYIDGEEVFTWGGAAAIE